MFKCYLYSKERDDYLRALKRSIIAGEDVHVPDEYGFLAKEWKESSELGVSPAMDYVPDSSRDMQVFNHITAFDKFRLAYLNDYYTRRDEVLGQLKCAIYYTYSDLAVYRKAGDAELLAELKAKGIRLGSKLTKEVVGTTAINVAKKNSNQVVCRIGSENYLEMFSDYAIYAFPWFEKARNASGMLMVVTRAQNCSELVQNAINFLLGIEGVTHEIYYPFTRTRADFLEHIAYNSDRIEIIIDDHGAVAFASKLFQETFDKKLDNGPPIGINQYVPELSYLTQFIEENGVPCQTREILLLTAEQKNRFFLAVPEMIRTESGCRGVHCVLQPVEKRKSSLTTPAGTGAKLRYNFSSIIGESDSIVQVKDCAKRAAENNSNVLILGESGTGKELFAQAIHAASSKKDGPFVPINCAALPKDLLNSELFGYEEGAFTGASKGGTPGKFEQANGGSIFLDEIGDMPLEMQSALLRVLEDNTVIRVGGKKYIPVDIRVIAATNCDLWKKVQDGSFRADLYFRLNIVTIKIPPLRARPEDIPMLADYLLESLCRKSGIKKPPISAEAISLLKSYSWPGNVRELRNVLERCLNNSRGSVITMEEIPPEVRSMYEPKDTAQQKAGIEQSRKPFSVDDWRGYNKDTVIDLMRRYGGNKSRVAKELGITRATFYKRLKEYGIE